MSIVYVNGRTCSETGHTSRPANGPIGKDVPLDPGQLKEVFFYKWAVH